jgi:hypothetical protein
MMVVFSPCQNPWTCSRQLPKPLKHNCFPLNSNAKMEMSQRLKQSLKSGLKLKKELGYELGLVRHSENFTLKINENFNFFI